MASKVTKNLKNIWILDDDDCICEALSVILGDAGYICTLFDSGKILKKQLKKLTPDLIIMDVMLTGEDGAEIAKSLKENLVTKEIPIILMSATAFDDFDVKESLVNAFIRKPFEMDNLLEIVALNLAPTKLKTKK